MWRSTLLTERLVVFVVMVALLSANVFLIVRNAGTVSQALWKHTHWSFLVSFSDDPQFLFDAGSYYMDSRVARDYDLDAAEKFIKKAVSNDPSILYGFHQLARISFLKGDFGNARAYIDLQILRHNGKTPNAYYVRGLIKGFAGDYESAAEDYEYFLKFSPDNWAALNDYAWVLLKASRPGDALKALDHGLEFWPENPWLWNNKATALHELGRLEEALLAADAAFQHVPAVTEDDWITAYPGNDPLIAGEGVAALRGAITANKQFIEAKIRGDN